jgi:hypothetical protein
MLNATQGKKGNRTHPHIRHRDGLRRASRKESVHHKRWQRRPANTQAPSLPALIARTSPLSFTVCTERAAPSRPFSFVGRAKFVLMALPSTIGISNLEPLGSAQRSTLRYVPPRGAHRRRSRPSTKGSRNDYADFHVMYDSVRGRTYHHRVGDTSGRRRWRRGR